MSIAMHSSTLFSLGLVQSMVPVSSRKLTQLTPKEIEISRIRGKLRLHRDPPLAIEAGCFSKPRSPAARLRHLIDRLTTFQTKARGMVLQLLIHPSNARKRAYAKRRLESSGGGFRRPSRAH
jgi:hypothetical protein